MLDDACLSDYQQCQQTEQTLNTDTNQLVLSFHHPSQDCTVRDTQRQTSRQTHRVFSEDRSSNACSVMYEISFHPIFRCCSDFR